MEVRYKNKTPVFFSVIVSNGRILYFTLFYGLVIAIFVVSAFNNHYLYAWEMKVGIPEYIIMVLPLILLLSGVLGFFDLRTDVDLEKKKFRIYRGNIIKVGRWRDIPWFEYLYISQTTSKDLSPTLQNKRITDGPTPAISYDLTMITKGNPDVLIYTSFNRNYILGIAREIAAEYHLKIMERTIDGDIEIN